MRLIGYKRVRGKIVLKTGLRIGGSDPAVQIGGMDNPIIREPVEGWPYIPGSSLKGKMSSLLELGSGAAGEAYGKPYRDPNGPQEYQFLVRIFGAPAGEQTDVGPGRLIVRDAMLTDRGRKLLEELRQRTGLLYAEEKAENTINRITGEATPRSVERVPAGTEFELDLVYRVFDINGDRGQADEDNFKYVLQGLKLIEMDTLGGSGSRGYGKVEFVDLVDEKGNPISLPSEEEVCAATA